MAGRWLTPKDMAAAKRHEVIWNAHIKRGLLDLTKIAKMQHVVCGCGEEGCLFITAYNKPKSA
jgi:hypothetical protein